jgi:hypothetical protein
MSAQNSDLGVEFQQPPFQDSVCIAALAIHDYANVFEFEASVTVSTNLQQPLHIRLAITTVVPAAALRRGH